MKSKYINVVCSICQQEYFILKHSYYKRTLKNSQYFLCSRECSSKHYTKSQEVQCKQCLKTFIKMQNQIKQSPNHFCSRSCAAIYNNQHKTRGIRRSKLEIWIEEQLKLLYPNLEIHYARKDAINGELDIYIPKLQLAFELNGIFHYEPIYGQEKLDQTINNDKRKFQACLERQIELVILDTSREKYFKKSASQKYLDIIVNIINNKLE